MSALTDQVDDHEDRITALEDAGSPTSDDFQQLQDDLSNSLDQVVQQQQDDEQDIGQLSFPLSQQSIDLITEQTPTALAYMVNQAYIGTAVLSSGTKTVSTKLVSASSLILLSRSAKGGTEGHLSYTATAGSFTITSSSGSETSTIIYFIIN